VCELGIVIWIFLGWQFTLAEFVGGLLLIVLMWIGVRVVVSRRVEEEEHALVRAGRTQARVGCVRSEAALASGVVGRGAQLSQATGRCSGRRSRRGARDPVCGMTVDRNTTPHRSA